MSNYIFCENSDTLLCNSYHNEVSEFLFLGHIIAYCINILLFILLFFFKEHQPKADKQQ